MEEISVRESDFQEFYVAYNRIKENYPEELKSIASTVLYDYITWSTKKLLFILTEKR